MKEYKVSYVTYKPKGSNDYFYEIIKANGLVHAHRLANEHAKKIGTKVSAIYERGSSTSF